MRKDQAGRSAPTLEELSEAVGFGPSRSWARPGPRRSRRRSFRRRLNDWAAREGFISRQTRRFGRALLDRHPRSVATLGLLGGSIGFGYQWASLTGHGLRGALTSPQLDNSTTYPNADAAFVAAIGLIVAGWLLVMVAAPKAVGKPVGARLNWRVPLGTLAALAFIGLGLFLISLAIWHY